MSRGSFPGAILFAKRRSGHFRQTPVDPPQNCGQSRRPGRRFHRAARHPAVIAGRRPRIASGPRR